MLYRVARGIARFVLFRWFRITVEGIHHLPEDGPAILVSNHVNYLDPLVMGVVFERPLHFMAKAELFEFRPLGWLLRRLYAFPVRRGEADRGAIRHALKVLADGHVLAMFPEGTRSHTGVLQDFQRGATMLALRSGAPVVPMVLLGAADALAGGRKVPRRVPLTVRIGPPLRFENGHGGPAVTAASDRIRAAMAALYPNGANGESRSPSGSHNDFAARKG